MSSLESINVKFGIKAVTDKLIGQVSGNVANRVIYSHPDYAVKTVIQDESDKSIGIINSDKSLSNYNGKNYRKFFRKTILWDFGDGFKEEAVESSHVYTSPGKYKITATFFDIDRRAYLDSFYFYVVVKEVIPTFLSFESEAKREIKCSEITKLVELNSFISKNYSQTFPVIPTRLDAPKENEKAYEKLKEENKNFIHLEKYYTFLEKKKVYKNNYRIVYDEIYEPVSEYNPEYNKIYTRFYERDGKIEMEGYYVSSVRGEVKLKIIDPNAIIEDEASITDYITCTIPSSSIEDGMSFSGYWGRIDVYYKNDYVSDENNSIMFVHDIKYEALDENTSASKSLYFNTIQLGFNFSVLENNQKNIIYYLSIDGFVKENDEITSNYKISDEVYHSITKNYDMPCYLVPIIKGEEGYYIPKDVSLGQISVYSVNDNDSSLYVSREESHPYCYKLLFRIKNKLSLNIALKLVNLLVEKEIQQNKLIIPKEQYHKEDFERLLKAYTPHKMFEEASELKSFLSNVFTNGDFLDYVLTRSNNFLDDTLFHKKSHLVNLISIMKSMGEDVSQFETSDFTGVNEIKDLSRILSMNHNDLVGHVIKKPYEIFYHTESDKGKNVGERVFASDILHYENGYIQEIERKGKRIRLKDECFSDGIIVYDGYTKELRLIQLYSFIKDWDGSFSISRYGDDWGWKLSLPDEYYENGIVDEKRAAIVDKYYAFYLLNPVVETYRIGHFLEEDTITEDVEDVEKWNDKNGILFRALDNIIKEKMVFDNSTKEIDNKWELIL